MSYNKNLLIRNRKNVFPKSFTDGSRFHHRSSLYHQNPLKQLTSRDNEDVSAENLKEMLQNVPKSNSSTQEKED
jgi:hypothetical protein